MRLLKATIGMVLTGDGKSYAVKFDTPGTYQYNCAVHGQQMSGTVVVRRAGSPSGPPPH